MISLPKATLRMAADLRTAEKGRRAAGRLGDHIGLRLLRESFHPLDVHALATSEDIEVVKVSSIAESGRSEWASGGLRIALSEKESPLRQRFTLAHELGHCLIFGIEKAGIRTYSREEEKRCDRFAAALLMPKSVFLREFNRRQNLPRTSVVRELAAQFAVSLRAALVRLNDLALVDPGTILLTVEPDMSGESRVTAGAYDKSTYRRLENLTAGDLGIEGALARSMSRLPGSRRVRSIVRLPTKQRALPRSSYSHMPAVVSCEPQAGDRKRLLVEIELVVDPLRPRLLKLPSNLQASLPTGP